MDRAEVAALVEASLDELVADQPELLDLDVTERSLSHHLANYIRVRVPDDLDVDVEYNRHGADPKRLHLPPRNALDREIRATTVFPDILVHKRNSDDFNLIVLEVKKPGEDTAYDDLKLRAFRAELGYRHTAHVILGRNPDGSVTRSIRWVDG